MPLLPFLHSCFVYLLSIYWDDNSSALLVQIFAKPFVGAMNGHIDAVSCMAKNPNHLKAIFSGSMDGGTYQLLENLLSCWLCPHNTPCFLNESNQSITFIVQVHTTDLRCCHF